MWIALETTAEEDSDIPGFKPRNLFEEGRTMVTPITILIVLQIFGLICGFIMLTCAGAEIRKLPVLLRIVVILLLISPLSLFIFCIGSVILITLFLMSIIKNIITS